MRFVGKPSPPHTTPHNKVFKYARVCMRGGSDGQLEAFNRIVNEPTVGAADTLSYSKRNLDAVNPSHRENFEGSA